MAFWTYILRCADGRFYTGHTDDLERRIAEHRTSGFCDFTARRRPIELVWSEAFPTPIEALEAEHRIKPWSRAKEEALIRGDWTAISYFARSPRERPSTTLGTNGGEAAISTLETNGEGSETSPFVSSEVETRCPPP